MGSQKKPISLNALLHDTFWESYQSKTMLIDNIDENDAFYNGDQWGEYDPSDGFPRIVMNIVKKGADQIASKINGTPLYLSYSAFGSDGTDSNVDCKALSQFDQFVLNTRSVSDRTFGHQSAVNGEVRGTEITYVRWDEDDESVKGIYRGGLAYEHIDPRHFAVANPMVPDIQKQEWVMFWSDVPVGYAKKVIDKEEDLTEEEKSERKRMIARENRSRKDDINRFKDIEPTALTRVYTRFFRIGGEVCYMCSTQSADLFAYPKPLSSIVKKDYAKKAQEEYDERLKELGKWVESDDYDFKTQPDLSIDYEDVAIGDYSREAQTEGGYRERKERFSLYPFAVYCPNPMNNSIFGYSLAHSMIKIQKGINFSYSMVMQCAQNNAFSKVIAKDGALRNQLITNEPGQILTDYTDGVNGFGIKFAESQPLPSDLTRFGMELAQQTAKTYGFGDVMSGEISNQDLSGWAVQQMVKQANSPIEQQQQLFWAYKKDLAYIRVMFYKHYIDETFYSWEYSDSEMEEQEADRKAILQGISQGLPMSYKDGTPMSQSDIEYIASHPVRKTHFSSIRGRSLWGSEFVISIDAQQGLADTKLTEEQAFESLILNGGISKMDSDTFDFIVKCDPAFSPATKASMMAYSKVKRKGEIAQYQAQIAELQAQLQQCNAQMEQMAGQMRYAKQYNENLKKEFSDKIGLANRYLKEETSRQPAQTQTGGEEVKLAEQKAAENSIG